MKSLGITRKVDGCGRLSIPVEARDMLDFDEKCEIDISVSGRDVVLTRFAPGCIFCDGKAEIKIYDNEPICVDCIAKIKKIIE